MASLIARGQQAKLVLVHVLDLPVTYSESPLVYTFAAEEVAAAERDLADTLPSDPDIVCDRKILKGETATSILRAAEDVHADLIVVGLTAVPEPCMCCWGVSPKSACGMLDVPSWR